MPARRPRRPHKLDDISRSPADESEELDAGPLIEPDADLSERVRLLAKLVRKNVLDQK